MPELPEVETVTRDLQRRIAGRTFVCAELRREKLAPSTTCSEFAVRAAGSAVIKVHRRGKHILIELANGRTLVVHLRMSGRFLLLSEHEGDPKFAHAVFYLDDGSRLVFDDQRHFGMMKLVDTAELRSTKEIAKLAPEPFSDEFSDAYFSYTVRSSDRKIKDILLDQTKVCGLGNIYASEAMHLSGVHPRKRGSDISAPRCASLRANIKELLSEAIDLAATVPPHPTIIGEGSYGSGSLRRWLVYDREGEPCLSCARAIKRIVQSGRSTYFCTKCQR